MARAGARRRGPPPIGSRAPRLKRPAGAAAVPDHPRGRAGPLGSLVLGPVVVRHVLRAPGPAQAPGPLGTPPRSVVRRSAGATGRRAQRLASSEPDTLCQTEKIAAGSAAAGAKCTVARAAARPEFCMPTSMLIARRLGTGMPHARPMP